MQEVSCGRVLEAWEYLVERERKFIGTVKRRESVFLLFFICIKKREIFFPMHRLSMHTQCNINNNFLNITFVRVSKKYFLFYIFYEAYLPV